MASKDPAFLFYSSDFLTGVSDLTMEERGQFITLLCIQHQKGRLTKKNVGIAVANASADTMAKFKIDENGLYYNERLEIESNKRKVYSDKQRQRALDGWKKRRGNLDATANATALPLENEDVNKDIIIKYTKENFLTNWNELRTHYLKLPSHLNKLQRDEIELFNENNLGKEKYQIALAGLFKQKYVPQKVMHLKPRHFLNNIDQYLDAENNKQYEIYSK